MSQMLNVDHPRHADLLTIMQAIEELSADLSAGDHAYLSSAIYNKALDLLGRDEDPSRYLKALERL